MCIRRSDKVSDIGDLFHEAVRCAQFIKLEQDPEGRYPPFEVEYRRRLWFHLCGLESRTAEEGGSRKYSILKGQTVEMPRNLNDCDLNPRMTVPPRSRDGITDSTFPILRYLTFAFLPKITHRIYVLRPLTDSSFPLQVRDSRAGIRHMEY